MSWLKDRSKERTTWDGVCLMGVGLVILFVTPLVKFAAGFAIAYGAYTALKSD